MHMELAALQFFVGQTRIFAPEYQGHLAIRLQVLQAGRRALARIQQRPGIRRSRALVPSTTLQPLRASSRVSTTLAASRMSVAPEARATASPWGKLSGCTSTSCDRPMFFMARAAPPMLPG